MDTSTETMSVLLKFFVAHPALGICSALTFLSFGSFAPHILEIQVPIIVMQSIQILFWVVGGIASILSIIAWGRTHLKK